MNCGMCIRNAASPSAGCAPGSIWGMGGASTRSALFRSSNPSYQAFVIKFDDRTPGRNQPVSAPLKAHPCEVERVA
jgi:hypothetical protein